MFLSKSFWNLSLTVLVAPVKDMNIFKILCVSLGYNYWVTSSGLLHVWRPAQSIVFLRSFTIHLATLPETPGEESSIPLSGSQNKITTGHLVKQAHITIQILIILFMSYGDIYANQFSIYILIIGYWWLMNLDKFNLYTLSLNICFLYLNPFCRSWEDPTEHFIGTKEDMCILPWRKYIFKNFFSFYTFQKSKESIHLFENTTEWSILYAYSNRSTGPRNITCIKDNLLKSGGRLYLFNWNIVFLGKKSAFKYGLPSLL